MKDYRITKQQEENELYDHLYKPMQLIPTQAILNMLDNHDCHLSPNDGCECVAYIKELKRRQSKQSIIL